MFWVVILSPTWSRWSNAVVKVMTDPDHVPAATGIACPVTWNWVVDGTARTSAPDTL